MTERSTSFGIQHRLYADAPTAQGGRELAELTRILANRITTVWAQNKTNIDVKVVVTLTVEEPA